MCHELLAVNYITVPGVLSSSCIEGEVLMSKNEHAQVLLPTYCEIIDELLVRL
jgi:hypothetical protein